MTGGGDTPMEGSQSFNRELKTRTRCRAGQRVASNQRGFGGQSVNSVLQRTTFRTSREMDFISERELVTQTGHGKHEWPLVIMKELCDNSLDACEEADIAPVIHIAADPTGIFVRDNGPGLPKATLQATLDFRVRVSNREAYLSLPRCSGKCFEDALAHALCARSGRGQVYRDGTKSYARNHLPDRSHLAAARSS